MRLAKELILADNARSVRTDGRPRRLVPDEKRFARLAEYVKKRVCPDVIVDQPGRSATEMFEERNLFVEHDGKVRYLDEISEVVRGMPSRIWRGRLYADRDRLGKVHEACERWLERHPVERKR
jgi:hypothetical protein